MKFRRSLRAPVLVVAITAGTLFSTASSASAAGGNWIDTTDGRGRATWTWSSNPASLDNITLIAQDYKCDGEGVYTYMKFYNANGVNRDSRHYTDPCSSGESGIGGLSWRDESAVTGVRVFACEDVWGSDSCSNNHYDNPNWP
jgi:hypothetical protein